MDKEFHKKLKVGDKLVCISNKLFGGKTEYYFIFGKTYTIGSQSIGRAKAIYVTDENRYMYFIGDMSYIYFETLEKYRSVKIDNLLT